jgi:hypothetical protein
MTGIVRLSPPEVVGGFDWATPATPPLAGGFLAAPPPPAEPRLPPDVPRLPEDAPFPAGVGGARPGALTGRGREVGGGRARGDRAGRDGLRRRGAAAALGQPAQAGEAGALELHDAAHRDVQPPGHAAA